MTTLTPSAKSFTGDQITSMFHIQNYEAYQPPPPPTKKKQTI